MPFVESSIKDFGSLLQNSTISDSANRSNPSKQAQLDFQAGDFAFFKPYVFGQYSETEQQIGTATMPSASPYASGSTTLTTITGLDMSCSSQDISFADFAGCDPTNPSFLSMWTQVGNYNQPNTTKAPTSIPGFNLAASGITDAPSLQKQCFRSHYCVNSILSKSLETIQSSKSGHEARFQDLEDMYFKECLNVFNMLVAMIFFIVIIISNLVYKSKTPITTQTR